MAYQLIGHVTVVLSGETFTNSTLHQSGERWEHIDRRIDLSVVKLTIDEDLAFSDVPSQVRDRMCDV